MKIRWRNRDALVTGFDGDDCESNLADIIFGSKFMKRAKEKGMAKIQDADESHITTRSPHMEQAAIQAKKLANKLGLNETVAYIGMMMHDAGHTFSSHEGEYAMNTLGELENVGYYHHSAKGLDVVINEGLIEAFINQIPEAKGNKELTKKLKEDVWYFFELIVGHDGESTKKDNENAAKTKKKYRSIKEAVISKASRANRTDQYKCSVETLEAQLSKPADILAYLKSDVLDAFSQGTITRFSDENLVLIGELLCESYEETEKIKEQLKKVDGDEKKKLEEEISRERILRARKFVNEIKLNHLREDSEDIDVECVEVVKRIMNELEENEINIESVNKDQFKLATNISARAINGFITQKEKKGINKNIIKAQTNIISDYLVKMQKTRKRVVEDIMDKMQDTLLEDYAQNTLKQWKEIENDESLSDEERYERKKQSMDFSDKGNEIIYGKNGMKRINYIDYVQYAKKEYQTGILPSSVYKLIMKSSKAIVRTGVIRNKFFDPSVTSKIKEEKLLNIMQNCDIDSEGNSLFKNKIGLNEESLRIMEEEQDEKESKKKKQKRYVGKRKMKKMERLKLYKDIYRNIQRQGGRFARYCEDVYYAIPYTVKQNVKNAIDVEHELNEYLTDEERKKIDKMRAKIYNYIGDREPTKEMMQDFIDEQIEFERSKIEEKIAILLCRDYIAGMNDIKIKDILVKTGIVSKRKIQREDKPSNKENKKVKEAVDRLYKDDSIEK